jgi:hypothetical protein
MSKFSDRLIGELNLIYYKSADSKDLLDLGGWQIDLAKSRFAEMDKTAPVCRQ